MKKKFTELMISERFERLNHIFFRSNDSHLDHLKRGRYNFDYEKIFFRPKELNSSGN